MNKTQFQSILDQIPWANLKDAYGSAIFIRSLLEEAFHLSTTEDITRFLAEIDGRINHQDILEDSILEILPALIALTQVRQAIRLENQFFFLARFLWVYNVITNTPGIRPPTEAFLPDYGVDSFDPEHIARNQAYHRLAHQVRNKLLESLPLWLDFLSHPDGEVRAGSAKLIALLQEPRQELGQVLQASYLAEKDQKVQASFLISLGVLFHDSNHEALLSWLQPMIYKPTSTNQLSGIPFDFLSLASAAIAYVFVSKEPAQEEIWQILQKAVHEKYNHEVLSWEVSLMGLAAEALTKLGRLDSDREKATVILLQALQALCQQNDKEEDDKEENAKNLDSLFIKEVLEQHLMLFVFEKFQRRTHEVLLEELDDVQRKVLFVLNCELQFWPPAQGYCGIPLYGKEAISRYLRISPQGPLDECIDLGFQTKQSKKPDRVFFSSNQGQQEESPDSRWPLWKWVRLSNRKEISEDELVQRLLGKLSFEQNFALCQDAILCPYFHSALDWKPSSFVQKLFTQLTQKENVHALPKVKQYADALLQNEQNVQEAEAGLVLEALFRLDPQAAQSQKYQGLRKKAHAYLNGQQLK